MNIVKNVVLWGGWYGSHNIGDQALMLTIVDLLGKVVKDVRFTVLSDNPDHVRRYGNEESGFPVEALHNRRNLPTVLRRLASSDLLIFGGGTPFFDERKHILAMLLIIGAAKLGRTPYMTWSVSSQEVHDPWARKMFRWVLNGAAAITYRDQHTLDLFNACRVTRPMHLVGDSVFWLDPVDGGQVDAMIARAGQRDSSRPLVALTPRTLRSRDGDAETHYRPKSAAQYEQEIQCFTAALDWIWEQGYQPIFISMNTVAPDDDRIAAREIIACAKHGQHALLVDEDIRPRLSPNFYRRCEFSFVARVHGSVTSAIGGCPPVMYAFAPKHAGIMATMGLQNYTLAEAQATPETTVAMLENIRAHREVTQQALADRLEVLRQEALLPAQLCAEIMKA